MVCINPVGCGEGLSSSRPPLFDGTNFATWKMRFRIYARSQGVKVWMAIEDDVRTPTKTVDDIIIEKKVSEYTLEEEATMNIAAKEEMVLTSALEEKEYKRVNNCKSKQQMWNKLMVTYEGTTDIKDSRMDTLIQEYENFKLQEGENIIDMETRFNRIIDELSQLGKNYTQNEKNRRVFKSLPPSWKVKVTTIKKMHNLNDNANASTNHPAYTPPKPKDPSPVETQDVCFKYKQPSHYKRECPKLSKGRSLVAKNGWDLSEDEEAPKSSEEVVNLLMALGDETTSKEIFSSNQEILNETNVQDKETSYKDNLDKENELLETSELKSEALRLKEENHLLIAQVKDQERILNYKIDALKKENENLEEVIQRFTKGNKMLDQMVCLAVKQDIWYLDSGCSRHMTGNKSLLNNIKKVSAGSVTFGDSSKGNIRDIGNEKVKISDVQLVTGLKYNLLAISQLCDNDYKLSISNRTYTAKEALLDEDWISAMQEELLQFTRSKVWELIPKPHDTSIIGT
ncbi:hypothetical protein AgCh_017419 [Apium graveolens]